MDWQNIKKEYISTEIGYRELAKKHNVSFTTLQRRAKKEDWPSLRRQSDEAAATAVMTAVTEEKISRAVRIENITDKLLDKIELTIDNIDGRKSNKAVKDVSDALKNVKDILGIKSEDDKEEQKARIAKLRKDTETEEKNTEITVSFKDADLERWSN